MENGCIMQSPIQNGVSDAQRRWRFTLYTLLFLQFVGAVIFYAVWAENRNGERYEARAIVWRLGGSTLRRGGQYFDQSLGESSMSLAVPRNWLVRAFIGPDVEEIAFTSESSISDKDVVMIADCVRTLGTVRILAVSDGLLSRESIERLRGRLPGCLVTTMCESEDGAEKRSGTNGAVVFANYLRSNELSPFCRLSLRTSRG